MRPRKPASFSIGDRVAYSASFLRSTVQVAGEAGALQATVTSVSKDAVSPSAGHLIIVIDSNGREVRALACNLTLISRIAIDAALAG